MEIDKEIREKKEIVNISRDIKDKFLELKRVKEGIQRAAGEYLQPIVQPLKTLTSIEQEKQKRKAKKTLVEAAVNKKEEPSLSILEQLNLPPLNNKYYGLRYEPDEKQFYIGNVPVSVTENSIIVGDKTYLRTPDLISLLTSKNFKKQRTYGKSDLQAYKDILEDTEAYKRSKNHSKPTKGQAYSFVNKLLNSTFDEDEDDDTKDSILGDDQSLVFSTSLAAKKGSGIGNKRKRERINKQIKKRLMMPSQAEHEYIYYDDPNELVDRLQLLYGEQLAGNVNNPQINNEIQNILEELEERGLIR